MYKKITHLLLSLTLTFVLTALALPQAALASTPEGAFTFDSTTGTIKQYNEASGGKEVEIPSEIGGIPVTAIGDNAFKGRGITSVKIPNSVKNIGAFSFQDCLDLGSMDLPDSLESIGWDAFKNTKWYNDQANGVVYVGKWVVGYKTTGGTVEITLAAGTKGIAAYAFDGKREISKITIPESVEFIGKKAIHNCSLTNITIPNSVKSIGESAFELCGNLRTVTIGSSVESIGSNAFGSFLLKNIVFLGNTAPTFEGNPFIGIYPGFKVYVPKEAVASFQSALASFIPTGSTIEAIAPEKAFAFDSATGTINDYIETIGGANAVIPSEIGGVAVTAIGQYAFKGRGITSVKIPNSVKNIEAFSFQDCLDLGLIDLPDSLESIGSDAFKNTKLYNGQAGVVYIDSWVVGYKTTEGTVEITLATGTKGIAEGAFADVSQISKITIPDSVKVIGAGAFYYCSALSAVTIPNSVTSIGDGAFEGCTDLETVNIGNSVESIGGSAFRHCQALRVVTIPNSVTSIGTGAFEDCISLSAVTIPNSVTSIWALAFGGCVELETVNIGNSVEIIGQYAFSNCKALGAVTIPNSVTIIGDGAFEGCPLSSIVFLGSNVPEIDGCLLYEAPEKLKVYVPTGAVDNYKDAASKGKLPADSQIIELLQPVITMQRAELRMDEPKGLRFITQLDKNDAFASITEYGTVILPTELIPDGKELTLNTVPTNSATKPNSKILQIKADKYEDKGDYILFTGVLTEIPDDKKDQFITARAYAIYEYIEGAQQTVYSNPFSCSVSEAPKIAP